MPSRQPSSAAPSASPPVVYRMDAADRLVWTNRSWRAFAVENHGDDVAAPDPHGATFRSMLGADASTVQIYRSLVARVRASDGEIQFRSDATRPIAVGCCG